MNKESQLKSDYDYASAKRQPRPRWLRPLEGPTTRQFLGALSVLGILLFVLGIFISGLGLIAYIVMAIIVPVKE